MAAAGESIGARIASHDEYFCRMVNLVPAHLYLHNDEPELNSRYFKNKKLAAPMQQKKEESRKGKRAKFDPANMKTVVELQKERALEDKQKVKEAKEALADGDDDDEEDEEDDATGSHDDEEEGSDDDGDEGAEGDGDDDDEGEEEGAGEDQGNNRTKEPTGKVPSASKKPDGPLALVGTTPRAKSIDELKERLRLKIEEARARRGGGKPGSDQKKPRPGKEKDKHQQQRLKSGKNATYTPGSGAAGAIVGSSPGNGRHQSMPVDAALRPPPPPVPELTDIQFGTISGMDDGGKKKKGKGSLPNLLKKAQEKERRLKELQQSEEGKEEANALLWKDAIKSAHGEKILDDPKRLKKAIKKKQKLKERSTRQWQARQAGVENSKKERQDKREANIKKRKLGAGGSGAGGADAVEAGKEQDGPGKGAKRRRAGFEGKRHEFLNSGKGSDSHGGQKPQHGSHGRNQGTGSMHGSGGPVKGPRKMQHQGGGHARR